MSEQRRIPNEFYGVLLTRKYLVVCGNTVGAILGNLCAYPCGGLSLTAVALRSSAAKDVVAAASRVVLDDDVAHHVVHRCAHHIVVHVVHHTAHHAVVPHVVPHAILHAIHHVVIAVVVERHLGMED